MVPAQFSDTTAVSIWPAIATMTSVPGFAQPGFVAPIESRSHHSPQQPKKKPQGIHLEALWILVEAAGIEPACCQHGWTPGSLSVALRRRSEELEALVGAPGWQLRVKGDPVTHLVRQTQHPLTNRDIRQQPRRDRVGLIRDSPATEARAVNGHYPDTGQGVAEWEDIVENPGEINGSRAVI